MNSVHESAILLSGHIFQQMSFVKYSELEMETLESCFVDDISGSSIVCGNDDLHFL